MFFSADNLRTETVKLFSTFFYVLLNNGRHLTENFNLESGTIICHINYYL